MNITLETVIGITLGILAISILFYLGAKIFSFLFPQSQEELQAHGLLDMLYNKLEVLSIGETTDEGILLESPKGWWLVSFDINKETIIEEMWGSVDLKKPDECFENNCICICKKVTNCIKDSVCKKFKKPLYHKGRPAYIRIELELSLIHI